MNFYVVMTICAALDPNSCVNKAMNEEPIPTIMGCMVAQQQIEAMFSAQNPGLRITYRRCVPERRLPFYLDSNQA